MNRGKIPSATRIVWRRNESPDVIQSIMSLICQAVANLVQNAIGFSRPGGKFVIGADSTNHVVQLRSEDGGTVIPAYALEKISNTFYSLKRPGSGRNRNGPGLNSHKKGR